MQIKLNSYWGHALLILVLAATFFYLDLLLPLGFAAGIPYVLLVLIGLWAESRRLIIFNSLLGTVLTILGAFYSPVYPDLIPAVFNRLISIGTLWLVTYFCLMSLKWSEEKYRGDLLEQANRRLKEESGYVQLHLEIASIVNLSRCLDEAITCSLQKICEFTKWPVGHLYLISEDRQTLKPSGLWYLKNKKRFRDFWNITGKCNLGLGEGLPGRVIAKGKAQFITDIKSDPNFPRASMAKEIEVASGFGFPVLIEDRPVGVMEFYSSQTMKPAIRMLEVMESIGILLGRVVERTQADKSKQEYSNRLRQLYHKLDSIREEESKRIAREVHDNLGQLLTSLKLEVSLLEEKLTEKKVDASENIKLMFNLIDKNIEAVKEISQELRPPILDTLSFTEAIDWQGRVFQEKTGIIFNFSFSKPKFNLDSARSTTLFRIFQECLTNISRHSEASKIQVDLTNQENAVFMRVRDNGIGLSEEKVNSIHSLGLLGMKERAQMLGGNVEIQGTEGVGTTVFIQLKYR